MRKRIVKTAGAVLVVAVVAALAACSRTSDSTKTTTQTAKVQRGDITVSTTSTGNLAFTQTEDVAFDMAGTVEQVEVEVGQSVTKGQVLATLDASAWDDQITKLEDAVAAAETALQSKERQIISAQFGVKQAEINVRSAQDTLYNVPEIKSAQQLVDLAQAALTSAQGASVAGQPMTIETLTAIRQQLAQAKANLQSVLAGTGLTSNDVALQIAKAELTLDQSMQAVEDAKQAVVDANAARDKAAQALKNAESSLQDARALNPKVVAPFDGIVTKVNVQGGQDINKGAVAVIVADPAKFEVGVLVGERDIASMAIGGLATVSVTSMTGVTLPGTITAIAPTASINQGVVNYQVTVEVGSLARQNARPGSENTSGATNPFSTGQIPGGRTGTGQFPASTGNQTGRPFGGGALFGGSLAVSQTTLRQGLSVTVNLVTASKSSVLMVPNRAITRQQGKSYVSVEKNNASEQVAVTTGISNSQYTEISSGLSEGDVVVIPITTTSTSSSTNRGGVGGGIFGGGGGAIPGGGILR